MNAKNTQILKERSSRLSRRYEQYFAGQPRHSRDPLLLDEMVEEASAIAADAEKTADPAGTELAESARQQRDLYRREAAEIRRIQDSGTDVFLIHEYRSWVMMTFDRYQRNFAGQSRSTRDAGLLADMIEDLERLDADLTHLEGRSDDGGICSQTRQRISENLTLYRSERQKVAEVRRAGSLEDQADLLAGAANIQFGVYGQHYAGKNRLSRSLGRLNGVINELSSIREQMSALSVQGFGNESNEKNIETVTNRLEFYQAEVKKIQAARANSSFSDLVAELGRAANELFEKYRGEYGGQARETRNLDSLIVLTEGLFDLARDMNKLDRVRDDDNNQHNLAVVLDHLRMYHREYIEIGKAKQRS
jgi:hypothetical protein